MYSSMFCVSMMQSEVDLSVIKLQQEGINLFCRLLKCNGVNILYISLAEHSMRIHPTGRFCRL